MLERAPAPDISPGLVGKTVTRPAQIEPIDDAFRVSANDLDCAWVIVKARAPAVFKSDGAMCEPATHYRRASGIIDRAKWYGVRSRNGGAGNAACAIACHAVVSSWIVRQTEFHHGVHRPPRLHGWHERCAISATSADAPGIRLLAASCRVGHGSRQNAGSSRRSIVSIMHRS
ncbi:HpcH/HpaI aldolase/citrate lyase family protein [Burkholderia stabilis]|uniref:HpcH/HpaI aldolase/citrate lyase family protein n=1 Tax=Burkholderia stabilis TaxID=95485 RepID=UPI00158CADA2